MPRLLQLLLESRPATGCSTSCPALRRALAGNGPALLPVPADDEKETGRLAPVARRRHGAGRLGGRPARPDRVGGGDLRVDRHPEGRAAAGVGAHRLRRGHPALDLHGGLHPLAPTAGRAPRRPTGCWRCRPPHRRAAGAAAGGRRGHRADGHGHGAAVHRGALRPAPSTGCRPGRGSPRWCRPSCMRILADPDATDRADHLRRRAGRRCVDAAGAAGRRRGRPGVASVTTYGMSETCGGCVYDGVPLDGVTVASARRESAATGRERRRRPGRVSITGPSSPGATGTCRDHPSFVPASRRALPHLHHRRSRACHGRGPLAGRRPGRRRHHHRRHQDRPGGRGIRADQGRRGGRGHRHRRAGRRVGRRGGRGGGGRSGRTAGPGRPARGRRATRTGPAAAPKHLVLVDELPLRGPGKPDRAADPRAGARRELTPGG